MNKISITVPVYNVEQYLERCLNSLLNQTFTQDYDIICVNDGSTDKSGEILESYARQYPKIKVINQENKGLSEARNTALEHVTGKYTMFVDSDDFIAPTALKDLYKYAETHKSDVVIFDFYGGVPGTKNIHMQSFPQIAQKYKDNTFNVKTADPMVYRFFAVATWSKIYRTNFVKDLKFEPGMINQDVAHWALVWSKAKRIHYLPKPLYFYFKEREGSITKDKGAHIFDVFTVFSKAQEYLEQCGYFNKYKYIHYAHFASNIMNRLKKITPELRKELINRIQSYDIDVDFNEFLKQGFYKFENLDMQHFLYIRKNDYATIEATLKQAGIW